jgi:hypothetical protein
MLKPSDHWQIRALFILYLLWLPLNLWALSSYPAPDSDEAWFASPALALRQTNQLTIPIFGDTTGMLQSQTLWRGYSAGLAVWTQVVGFGLVQTRMFSLLPVALTGLLLFWFGRRTIHAQAGIFAAAFYLLSLRIFPASHFARPDTWVQFLGVASWVAFWKLVTTPKLAAIWVFAFGCLVTASADLYPLVLYFTAASGAAFGLFCLYNKKWAWLGWFILGCSVGTAYYLALRFLPNPLKTWQEMHSVQSFYESNVPKPNDWQAISDYFTAFLIPFVLKQGILGHSRLAPIEFLLGSVGLSVLCVQHSNRNNFLLWSGLCLWVGFLLPYKGLHHLVEFTPWVSLLCTVGVFGLGGLWRVGMRRFEPPSWLKRYAGGWSSSEVGIGLQPAILAGQFCSRVFFGISQPAPATRHHCAQHPSLPAKPTCQHFS